MKNDRFFLYLQKEATVLIRTCPGEGIAN